MAQIRELMVQGFKLVGLYDADKLQAVAGFVVNANLVSGKKLYVEDLVTLPEARSPGKRPSLPAPVMGMLQSHAIRALLFRGYAIMAPLHPANSRH